MVTANPKTAGVARWNFLALWGHKAKQGDAACLDFVTKVGALLNKNGSGNGNGNSRMGMIAPCKAWTGMEPMPANPCIQPGVSPTTWVMAEPAGAGELAGLLATSVLGPPFRLEEG